MIDTTYASARVIDEDVEPELCWVDFETTGLDSDPGAIPLEVGVIITDKMCRPRASFQSLIMERNWLYRLSVAPKVVQDMHDKNDLKAHLLRTQDLLPAGGPSAWFEVLNSVEVNKQLFDFLHEHGGGEGKLPMAGSTVNFDRRFMQAFLPHCNEYLHYRNVDVTTLKNLCRMHNPRVYAALPQTPADQKWHRPMQDLAGSMEEYLFYLDNFLYTA
jgi:oligoribonuclease